MVNLHPALPAAPWAMPVRAPAPVETAVAIRPADASLRARGDGIAEPGGWARAEAARYPRPDPEEPFGPPPAFRANVLEGERARLSDPSPPAAGGRPGPAGTETFPMAGGASARVADDPAARPDPPAYREARFGGGPPSLDLTR